MGDSLQDLIDKVVQWGNDRNLSAADNLKAQTMKLVSEFGEIGLGLVQLDDHEVADGIGDSLVVAIIIGQQIELPISADQIRPSGQHETCLEYQLASGQLGLFVDAVLKGHDRTQLRTLLVLFVEALCDFAVHNLFDPHTCLASAYDEIKDRKGVMLNGAFIKEADPRYADALRELGR